MNVISYYDKICYGYRVYGERFCQYLQWYRFIAV